MQYRVSSTSALVGQDLVPSRTQRANGLLVAVINEAHLMAVLKEFAAYYNRERPHRNLGVVRPASWRLRPDLNALTRCGRTPACAAGSTASSAHDATMFASAAMSERSTSTSPCGTGRARFETARAGPLNEPPERQRRGGDQEVESQSRLITDVQIRQQLNLASNFLSMYS
jgi:hypothetical protein